MAVGSRKTLRVVGSAVRKVDGLSKCAGVTKFADDIVLPRMLFCKLHRSPVPHARIVGIDTSKALKMPGVIAVLTGRDLPIPFGILPVSQDEHALCPDKVRFVGDPVAAVAALDEDIAFEAMNAIEVEYEPLDPILSIEDAIKKPSPRIHDYGDEGNIHKKVALEFGDVERGLAQADEVLEDTFYYEGSTHLPMEQHAAVGMVDPDGKLTVWSSTQTPHYVHRALAKVLEMPPAHVRVIACPNGGGSAARATRSTTRSSSRSWRFSPAGR
jgi:4-hydroxybenzoyl-CoA reductase subunit alpha